MNERWRSCCEIAIRDRAPCHLRAGLRLLAEASEPGTMVDLPFVWSDSTEWMRRIFSEAQPFLSPEAEAQRLAELARARQQKGAG